jgi:hypothetical protein
MKNASCFRLLFCDIWRNGWHRLRALWRCWLRLAPLWPTPLQAARVVHIGLLLLLVWLLLAPSRTATTAAVPTSADAALAPCPMHIARQIPIQGLPRFVPGSAALPAPAGEAYVRPELARRLERLRPAILAAAARHNRPQLSGMNTTEFARVIALLIYNEHNGWLEDEIEVLRVITPLYEDVQVQVNQSGLGSNFSVWPTNLRPSVALEILRGEVPLPQASGVLTVPLEVAGSQIDPAAYATENELLAAITQEIAQDRLGVEYMAANLERGLYRAEHEGVTVDWRVLAGWHNQGIVQLDEICAHPQARSYVQRSAAYLPLAARLLPRHAPMRLLSLQPD